MKLRIYTIVVTVALIAVLANPSAERHYEKLAQFYPWVNESRLADARMEVWSLSPTSEREKWLPYDSLTNDGSDIYLIYTSLGVLSFVQCDERCPPCGNDEGPSKPISIGFLGYVFAKRPPSPEELETRREREAQAQLDRLPKGISSRSSNYEGSAAIVQAATPPSTTTTSDSPSEQSVSSISEQIRAASKPQRATVCDLRQPTVEVMRGGTVEASLNARHRNLNPLVFRIIEQPRFGELSNLLQQSIGPSPQRPWQVTYTHGNDPNSATDSFVYEVTDPSTGRRGRGRMTILILDAPSVRGP
jgi:hypothetical protein